MTERYCICTLKSHFYEPVSNLLILLELSVSIIISALAIMINYRFKKRLQEEKRARPLGRKGNIAEPIMSWFCVGQISFTPIYLLLHWIYANEIVPFDLIPDWLCQLMRFAEIAGSLVNVYNSLFLVAIRYVYIVHLERANNWNFEKVGKRFQIASIAVPLGMQLTCLFTTTYDYYYKTNDQFKSCVDSFLGTNSTIGLQIPKPILVQFTLNYFPETCLTVVGYVYNVVTALVALNIIDTFLYHEMFKHIKR